MGTPASDRFRVIYHPLICPDCAKDMPADKLQTPDTPRQT